MSAENDKHLPLISAYPSRTKQVAPQNHENETLTLDEEEDEEEEVHNEKDSSDDEGKIPVE